MLKGALRLSHAADIPAVESYKKYFQGKVVGASLDNAVITNSEFKLCVFADCGMKGVTFEDCRFLDCVFSGCYLKDSTFKDCTVRGCQFEICTTTGISLSGTTIEHVEFFRCVFPFKELEENLGNMHGSNDKMLLNCAAEAHRIGRWREAEKFLTRHLKEKRRYWRAQVFSRNRYYSKYSGSDRSRAFLRLCVSLFLKYTVGDHVSITRMSVLGLILLFAVGPLAAWALDGYVQPPIQGVEQGWLSAVVLLVQHYWSYLVESVNLMLGSSLTASYQPKTNYRDAFEIVSRISGILFLAIMANLLTRSLGSGPKW